jgi:RimJ/RimL family protein N-acetyltransferase
MIPKDLVLETDKVLLRPVEEKDISAFAELAKTDPSMWNYFTLNLADDTQLRKWMDLALNEPKAGLRAAFTIIDKASGHIAGSSSMGNISWHDLRLEIGWSWLGPAFRSTGVNLHAKFSMMRYAFEELSFERVEFKTDVLNARARKGLQKVGRHIAKSYDHVE